MGIGRTRYYYGKPQIHVGFNPPNNYEFTEQLSQESVVNKKSN